MKQSPRCPYCNAQGIGCLAAKNMGRFSLIYCGQCGAIYGVVPEQPAGTASSHPPIAELNHPTPTPKPRLEPQPKSYANPGQPDPLPHRGKDEDNKPLTPDQAAALYDHKLGQRGTYYHIYDAGDDDGETQ